MLVYTYILRRRLNRLLLDEKDLMAGWLAMGWNPPCVCIAIREREKRCLTARQLTWKESKKERETKEWNDNWYQNDASKQASEHSGIAGDGQPTNRTGPRERREKARCVCVCNLDQKKAAAYPEIKTDCPQQSKGVPDSDHWESVVCVLIWVYKPPNQSWKDDDE